MTGHRIALYATQRPWVFEVREFVADGYAVCAVRNLETNEVREQSVYLDKGRRPGHLLWFERASRRIETLDEDHLIPYHLVS